MVSETTREFMARHGDTVGIRCLDLEQELARRDAEIARLTAENARLEADAKLGRMVQAEIVGITERAAIMEFDGGLSREEAEKKAVIEAGGCPSCPGNRFWVDRGEKILCASCNPEIPGKVLRRFQIEKKTGTLPGFRAGMTILEVLIIVASIAVLIMAIIAVLIALTTPFVRQALTDQKERTIPVVAPAESGNKRFIAEFQGEFQGGYDNHVRSVFILTDNMTQRKYLAITGCGVSELWTETRTHHNGKTSHTMTETKEE